MLFFLFSVSKLIRVSNNVIGSAAGTLPKKKKRPHKGKGNSGGGQPKKKQRTRSVLQQQAVNIYKQGYALGRRVYGPNLERVQAVKEFLAENHGTFVPLPNSEYKAFMAQYMLVAKGFPGGLLVVNLQVGSAGIPRGLLFSMPAIQKAVKYMLKGLQAVHRNVNYVVLKIARVLK